MSTERLRRLIYEIGRALARIHAGTFSAFGKLNALDYKSWAEYVYDYIERSLQQARQRNLLDTDLQHALERARAMHDFAEVTSPALIHCDFHYENILHQNGQLSGILDFEWALAGDSDCDFMIPMIRQRMVQESERVLRAGYQSLCPLSSQYHRRVFGYRLFCNSKKL